MKKLRIVFTTFVLGLVVSGCSNSEETQQVQPQEAKVVQGNIFVSRNNEASDIKDLGEFLEAVNNGKQANLQIRQTTDEGDPTFTTLEYNNGIIKYTYDNSQDKYAGTDKGIQTSEYAKAIKEENNNGVYVSLIDKSGGKRKVYISPK
ncbi:DUF4362 domain-containing protein [Desulfosporosinus shakirovi]|uniref:DUF4362 domain-containing protein n=1 Tax=Desulfosporosinus shakirovi TaxID=2885154 RepID=UPI001E36B29C|nr:DUF4362 domain-containing protein [Desulfosporosinus sp. SRJS8]MCB8815739.1 DUF4362 domain-containing protein [Desulfosporosinus sp. SRJS8]